MHEWYALVCNMGHEARVPVAARGRGDTALGSACCTASGDSCMLINSAPQHNNEN